MILTGIGVVSSRSCPAELINSSNLEIYYKLNGNAIDSSGESNNGIATNMLYEKNGMFSDSGIFEPAFSRRISAPQKAYGISTAFTLAAWFKTSTTTGSGQPQMIFTADRLIAGDPTNSARVWQLRLDDVTSYARLVRFDASVNAVTNIAGTTSLSDGNWHHIAATFSTTNGSVLYVDGVSIATDATLTANADRSNTRPMVGCAELGTGGVVSTFFDGNIDEVILFNRECTISEIEILAKGTCPLKA